MNKIKNILGWGLCSLTLAFCFTACDTDVESVKLVEPNIANENPSLYQAYLQNLKAYKNSDHKKTYVWFDNSEKTPFSRAQHYSMIPDSVDYVSPIYPEDLQSWELGEIQEMKADKGTKFLLTVDYDAIKADYNAEKELDEESEPTAAEFQDYLANAVSKLFGLADTFGDYYDGIVFFYTGKSTMHLNKTELREYTANENAFIGLMNDWKSRHTDKVIAFVGKPQNVMDKTILNSCETILLSDGLNATSADILNYDVNIAVEEGAPTSKLGMICYGPTQDPTDPARKGYISDDVYTIDVMAEWTRTTHTGFTVNAMGIYGINDDYYNTNMVYYHTRKAIDTVNPSVK